MKLKRTFALIVAICMLGGAAMAEQDTQLEGFVTEIVEGGFIMEDIDLGKVTLNVDEATQLDGVLQNEAIEVGQYVFVTYDGRLTRSIPPQAHADKVGCYRLNGTVGEYLENGVLLTGDPTFGDVIVHVSGGLPHLYTGMPVTVYYNGVMALSLPGQVSGSAILVPELHGEVSELDEEGFLLTTTEESYRVLIDDSTLVGMLAEAYNSEDEAEGEAVLYDALPQEEADSGEFEGDDADSGEAESPEGLKLTDGDSVIVYYNGMLTKSIPAQLTALEIIIQK